MKRALFLLLGSCLVLLLSGTAEARPEAKPPSRAALVEALVQRAKALDLANDPMWHRLLHYRSGLFGVSSQADWKGFFASPDGKDDPEAELEATLRGFFGPKPTDKSLEHPFCRFPARLAWLNARLGFDFERLPRRSCPRFQKFVDELRARSLTLVFSSYYLNNPSSAFGHTFLRINKRTRTAEQRDLELLDYGVDYSALVDTNNAFIYAMKGLSGQFPGTFRRVPFYLKVREYNDSESRDLWEYELDLSRAELSMVVAHLWELGPNYFDYFYLDENCSYHILAAIEVASPRIHLLDRLSWPVLPVDTIRAVSEQSHFVKSIHYRASNRSQYRQRVQSLNGAEARAVAQLTRDPDAKLPANLDGKGQARVLDAALDLIDFRFAKELVRAPDDKEDPESVRFKQRLLERRAELDVESEDSSESAPFRDAPHLGHGSRRLGLGSGHQEGRGWFHSLDMRLALHDLADPGLGYPETASIEFLPAQFRYYVESPKLELERFSLITVSSISPFNPFEHSLSWTLDVGATRIRDGGCDGCLVGTTELGGGIAMHLFHPNLLFFALADARLYLPIDAGLAGFLRAGVGPSGGLRIKLSEELHALGKAYWLWLPKQEPTETYAIEGAVRWQYTRDFALGVEATRYPEQWFARGVSYIYF